MYLIDGRGQHLLRSLGLSIFERLVTSAVAMADAKIGVLTPKGLTERVNPIKAGLGEARGAGGGSFLGGRLGKKLGTIGWRYCILIFCLGGMNVAN